MITLSIFWILVGITTTLLYYVFKPYKPVSHGDIGYVFQIFLLIPVGFIWAIYFGIKYWMLK